MRLNHLEMWIISPEVVRYARHCGLMYTTALTLLYLKVTFCCAKSHYTFQFLDGERDVDIISKGSAKSLVHCAASCSKLNYCNGIAYNSGEDLRCIRMCTCPSSPSSIGNWKIYCINNDNTGKRRYNVCPLQARIQVLGLEGAKFGEGSGDRFAPPPPPEAPAI